MARSNKGKGTSTHDQNANLGESVDELGSTAAELGSTAAELGGEAKEQVINLTQQAREQATEQVMSQKEKVVDTLETVALLLHQAGEHAHQQDKELLAAYVDKAAGQVAQWSETLEQQDVTQLTQSVTQFARREPMLFVGGALAAGFLGARFFRTSSQQPEQGQQEQSLAITTQLPDIDLGGSQMPAYDIDQSTTAPAGAVADMPLDTATSLQADLTPEEGGFLEDYEGAILEGDDFNVEGTDTPALNDTDDLTGSGRL
jgi:hypothetical protein